MLISMLETWSVRCLYTKLLFFLTFLCGVTVECLLLLLFSLFSPFSALGLLELL